MVFKRYLGEILTDRGLITNKQLYRALQRQKELIKEKSLPEKLQRVSLISESRLHRDADTAPLLGQILTSMGLVSENDLKEALAEQVKVLDIYKTLDSLKLGMAIEMASIINSTLNLSELLSLIMRHVNRLTDSTASTLMLLDDQTGELVFSVPTGPEAEKLLDIRLPPGKGIAGWVAANERPILVADVKADPRFYAEIDAISGLETKSILCVPLKSKTRLIGVLEAVNKEDGTHFTEEDELFLSIFASQAALAIENARLYSELKDQLDVASQMQKIIAHSEKFEALGQMASGIAHDFNNILSAIMGYSEIAMYDLVDGDKAKRSLDQVLKASNRAKDLVKQILAFSRQSDQKKKPVEVHLIVKEALKLLRASIPSTIEIKANIGSNAGAILADPTQIHQIMMNLCTNAHHAMMETGGILEVSLTPETLEDIDLATYPELKPGPYIKLSIRDTGHGMEPRILDRVFHPYFTTKKKGLGTGMGLAVVHGIVKSHGGAISVFSEVNKGTVFNVLLPRIEYEAEPEQETFEALPLGEEKILFVDDEKAIADLGKQMLERLGYTVFTRTSPVEALEAFRAQPHKFDIVVTDKTMPNMTGFDLAVELRRIRPDIPIILCTGFSESAELRKAGEVGISEMVMKPLVMSDLAYTIREVLEKVNLGA